MGLEGLGFRVQGLRSHNSDKPGEVKGLGFRPGPLLLGASWDLVSTVISILIGVIANSRYGHLVYSPKVTEPHEAVSGVRTHSVYMS